MTQYRILVTGSRTWTDELTVGNALMAALSSDLPEPGTKYVIVHGACPQGADAMAARFCENEAWWVDNAGAALIEEPHPVDWRRCAPACHPGHRRTRRGATYCPAAGLRRDAAMVAAGAAVCLAFIDPCTQPKCRRPQPHGSHGATYTATLAEKAGIPVRRWTA